MTHNAPDGFRKRFTNLQVSVFRLAKGRLGNRFWGLPVLLLTATGHRTGLSRTQPLNYVLYGGEIFLIAANAGKTTAAAWWLNLQKNPRARIEIGREIREVIAEEITGPERDRLWAVVLERNPAYQIYEKSVGRPLPVIRLQPVS